MTILDFFRKQTPTPTPPPTPTVEKLQTTVVSINLSNSDFPSITEVKNKDWVMFGTNNNYPDTLIDLYNSSSIHQSIVTQKSKMIAGGGYTLDETRLSFEQKVEVEKMLRFFSDGKDIQNFIDLISGDWELFGACSIEVIWSKDFSRVVKVNRVNPRYIRSGKFVDGKVEEYYFSDNWTNTRTNPPVRIPAFSISNKTDYTQMMYFKKYNPSQEYYGTPGYISSTNWILADSQIGVYHNNNISNGFAPGVSINFMKKPASNEEKDIIVGELKRQYQGARNAGKPLVFFSDGPDNRTIIEQIGASDLDKQFTVIHEQIVTQICSGHRVTSTELFGIAVAGRLGNADITSAYNIFEKTVINPERQTIQRIINDIFLLNALPVDFKLIPLNILV